MSWFLNMTVDVANVAIVANVAVSDVVVVVVVDASRALRHVTFDCLLARCQLLLRSRGSPRDRKQEVNCSSAHFLSARLLVFNVLVFFPSLGRPT